MIDSLTELLGVPGLACLMLAVLAWVADWVEDL